jgi:hypothetical protein
MPALTSKQAIVVFLGVLIGTVLGTVAAVGSHILYNAISESWPYEARASGIFAFTGALLTYAVLRSRGTKGGE